MKLYEFQAKNIFLKSGIPVPNGRIVTAADQVAKATQIIDGPP